MANGDDYAGLGLSTSELKTLTGWPDPVINDYTESISAARKAAASSGPTASGTTDPEGNVIATGSGFYVDTSAAKLWFNPTIGSYTGWIQL